MQAQSRQAEADIGILERLNQAYVDAVQNSDVGWFEEHLSRDFLNSNTDGSLVDRAGFLAQILQPATVRSLQPRDVRIRIFGDIAIVHARTTYSKANGQAAAGRYTDIWARRDGRWECVAAHVTRG
jgi:ketosteroid isomerase-like protein